MEHQPRAAQQGPSTPWTAAPAETSASTHRPAGSTRQWSVTSTTHANRDFWGPHHQSSGSSSPVLTPFAISLQPTITYRIRPTSPGSRRFGVALWGQLVKGPGWYIRKDERMDSRLRGNDRTLGNDGALRNCSTGIMLQE